MNNYFDITTNSIIFSLFYNAIIRKITHYVTNIFRSNIITYLVKCNIIIEIDLSKTLLIKKQSLIFDKKDKAIEFRIKFKIILKYIRVKKRFCLIFN